jgi:hypothetical protein
VISNERNSINITVLTNNFPYGFLGFPSIGYTVTVGKFSTTANIDKYIEFVSLIIIIIMIVVPCIDGRSTE